MRADRRYYGFVLNKYLSIAIIAAVLGPTDTALHLALQSSQPAEGDTVRTDVEQIRLSFTQRIELRYTAVTLRNAIGDTIAGSLEPFGDANLEVLFRLSSALASGSYAADWRTAGADGHVVRGTVRFMVEGAAAASPTVPTLAPGTPQMVPHAEAPTDLNLTPWSVALRWLNFLALLLCIGGVFFQALVDRVRGGVAVSDAYHTGMIVAARRLAFMGVGLGLMILVPRLLVQSAALHERTRMLDAGLLFTLLRDTNWGRGWIVQLLGLLGFGAALLIASKGSLLNWGIGGVAAMLLAIAPALSGHAAANERTPLLVAGEDAIHVLAAGSWLGTLAYVLLAATRRALRPPDEGATRELAALVRDFSPLALICVSVLLLTGVLSAVTHLGAIADLWTTSYGRTLSIKLAVVILVLGTGFYNWRRVRPALGTAAGTLRLQRSAAIELLLAVVVLGLTAVLVALPTP